MLLSGLISAWLVAVNAHSAFDISPIVATITPGQANSSASITVTNGDDNKTPVQISLVNRKPDIEGKEKYDDSSGVDDIFQVYPSQLILNPKEKRTVRITYVGDPKIKQELAYRIVAEEFPINVRDPNKKLERSVGNIFLATRYIGSLYVTPVGTKYDLQGDASPSNGKNGTEMIFVLQNKGTSHVLVKRPKVTMKSKSGGKEFDIPFERIPNLQNANLLAGMSRRFTLPWPKELPVGPATVTVEVPKEK